MPRTKVGTWDTEIAKLNKASAATVFTAMAAKQKGLGYAMMLYLMP